MDLNDAGRKTVFKVWKAHGPAILRLIEAPVSNISSGISAIDWEIHLTTHSRHQSNIQKQTATVLIDAKESGRVTTDSRIIFEMSKRDAESILDKIDSVLWTNLITLL